MAGSFLDRSTGLKDTIYRRPGAQHRPDDYEGVKSRVSTWLFRRDFRCSIVFPLVPMSVVRARCTPSTCPSARLHEQPRRAMYGESDEAVDDPRLLVARESRDSDLGAGRDPHSGLSITVILKSKNHGISERWDSELRATPSKMYVYTA